MSGRRESKSQREAKGGDHWQTTTLGRKLCSLFPGQSGACKHRTGQPAAGGFQVQGQSGLCRETLSKKDRYEDGQGKRKKGRGGKEEKRGVT